MLLREFAEICHQCVDGIFHMQMPDGDPDRIGLGQESLFLLLSAYCVLICVSAVSGVLAIMPTYIGYRPLLVANH